MRKFLIFIILLGSLKGYTQGPAFYQADRITANKALWVGNMRMDSISNDSFLTSSSAYKLSTQRAVKKYVDNTFLRTSTATGTYFPLTGGSLTGTGGNGYVGFSTQSAAPATPSTGFRLYADASNRFSWKGANGYVRTFDGTGNTADRNYTLPNFSGTLPLLENSQTFTGKNVFTYSATGSTYLAKGLVLNGTNTTAANNDTLVSFDINPTFNNAGAYTGTKNIALRVVTGCVVIGDYIYNNMSYGNVPKLYVNGNVHFEHSSNVQMPGYVRWFENGTNLDITQQSQLVANSFLSFGSDANGTYYGNVGTLPTRLKVGNSDKVYVFNTGNVSVGSSTDAGYKLDANGTIRGTKFQLATLNTAPSSSSDTGTTGEIRIVNGFIYVCVATNTWQRSTLSTF